MIRHSQYFTEELFAESMIALIDIKNVLFKFFEGVTGESFLLRKFPLIIKR